MRTELEHILQEFGILPSSDVLDKLERYYELLITWNEHTNLTALTESQDYIYKHIFDSLYPARFFHFRGSLIDVGTGAGFPGLPLKIAYPEIHLHLLEAAAKRVDFLKHCCTSLDIAAEIYHTRAEELGRGPGRGQYDVAVARAVAALPVLCEYCLPLLRTGGVFLAMKGPGGKEEAASAINAVNTLGGSVKAIQEYSLPTKDERCLIIIEKLYPTPDKYPRRPGAPAKRPL